MKFKELKKSLNDGEVSPIYYFYGDDYYLVERGIKMLKDKFLSFNEMNLNNFYYEKINKTDILELLSALSCFPFMSEKRIVVVKNFFISDKDFKEILKDYFDNPEKSTILIIDNVNYNSNVKTVDLKRLKNVTAVDCNCMEKDTLEKWIYTEFKKNNVEISSEAISNLCDFTLNSMTRISKECEKLMVYAGETKKITAEDIEQLISKDSDYQLYELTNEIANGNYNKSLNIFVDIKNKGLADQIILVKIYGFFRNLLMIAITNKTNLQLAEIFKVKEYAVKKMRELSEKFSKKSLKNIIIKLATLDSKIKIGKINIEDAIYLSILNILNEN